MSEMKIFHFFCRKHFERTLNRKFANNKCKQTKKHLYNVLYFKKIDLKCKKNIKKTNVNI